MSMRFGRKGVVALNTPEPSDIIDKRKSADHRRYKKPPSAIALIG
jgi:hypothetical protein